MILFGLVWIVARLSGCGCDGGSSAGSAAAAEPVPPPPHPTLDGDGVKVGTFLGNYGRRFYGRGPAPSHLDLLWRVRLGSGWSSGKYDKDPPGKWSGSGWTGQANVVVDDGRPYVIASGYDYRLRRIDARSGKVVWAYRFDDIIKSSPSVYENPDATGGDDRFVVVAGSRRGYPYKLADPRVAPYRAIAFGSGEELWRLPVPQTRCYSRDCDGSGFFLDGRQYIGVESGWFYALDPAHTEPWKGHRRPAVVAERLLLGDRRARSHGRNLVLESSASALGKNLYIASGAGHVYGLRRSDLAVVWDYFTGSDLDGTAVTTARDRLLVAVEKQYIKGKGGMLSLDPSKPAAQATEWFFPTGDREVGDWAGGVVGSAAVNDEYNEGGRHPALCAFMAIDGYLYIVSQEVMAEGSVRGPNLEPGLSAPVLVAKIWNGGGISTPILFDDTLIAAGYDQRVHLFHLTYARAQEGDEGALPAAAGGGRYWTVSVAERDEFYAPAAFESTPTLWDGRVYIGCRDGWFYCLGDAP